MDINRLQKQNLLQIFDLIITNGSKADGIYQFSGIRASYDFDGYTCWLGYQDLTITLLFHGAYHFDYKDEDTLKAFFKKVAGLLADKDNL
ncbi:MAG: DUF3081 family protein [Moritella sp.]|uniref:DUF3081 family protein n=1 Tax=Moritella sp. TaxID=78556 RepID=UPI0029AB8D92|nr:DUF3081 family protein [Moritella sp.]MDX2319559.1 DUF3081 family protein [Moritella sp.]